jgi:hypothetical protein
MLPQVRSQLPASSPTRTCEKRTDKTLGFMLMSMNVPLTARLLLATMGQRSKIIDAGLRRQCACPNDDGDRQANQQRGHILNIASNCDKHLSNWGAMN